MYEFTELLPHDSWTACNRIFGWHASADSATFSQWHSGSLRVSVISYREEEELQLLGFLMQNSSRVPIGRIHKYTHFFFVFPVSPPEQSSISHTRCLCVRGEYQRSYARHLAVLYWEMSRIFFFSWHRCCKTFFFSSHFMSFVYYVVHSDILLLLLSLVLLMVALYWWWSLPWCVRADACWTHNACVKNLSYPRMCEWGLCWEMVWIL